MEKFLCRNPELDDDTKLLIKAHKRIEKQLECDKLVYRATHRLLLLGAGESGKSTIVKQMRILHINGFSDEDRKEKTECIKGNIRDAITEYFDSVSELWNDKGVRECYERSDEFQPIDFFWTSWTKYDGIITYPAICIFDVGGQRDERRKWIQCFNDVTAILFVAALSDYSAILPEDNSTNRLVESLKLFNDIWTNRWLKLVSIILFLNKRDSFSEKIKSGRHRLQDYFPAFRSFRFNEEEDGNEDESDSNVLAGRQFIKREYLKIVNAAPAEESSRKCYPHYTCAVDTDNIRIVFNSCRKIIQKIHLQQWEIV